MVSPAAIGPSASLYLRPGAEQPSSPVFEPSPKTRIEIVEPTRTSELLALGAKSTRCIETEASRYWRGTPGLDDDPDQGEPSAEFHFGESTLVT